MRKTQLLCALGALLSVVAVQAQDQPSLGDVARHARQQKQEKSAQLKQVSSTSADAASVTVANDSAPSKPARVISNDNIFEHVSPAGTSKPAPDTVKQDDSSKADKQEDRTEQVRSDILSQKAAVDSLKQQIEDLSNSIHFAGANCVANCAQWNERQKEKQDQVESMKAQLDAQQKHLEEMQDAARKAGFGSSVYEP